jgi:hypothetical protein
VSMPCLPMSTASLLQGLLPRPQPHGVGYVRSGLRTSRERTPARRS